MSYSTIVFEKSVEEKLGIITLNRPEVRNAINPAMREDLSRCFLELEADTDVRAILITGGPKVFAAGADIAAMVEKTAVEQFSRASLWDLTFRMEQSRKPIIAAIAGFCLGGGCELAMACDVRIAAESAKFGQAEINIGIIPGGGGTVRLTRLVGLGKAMELVLTGRMISAAEALRINLVNEVVPDEQLMAEAKKMAQVISRHSPVALGLAKYAVQNSVGADLATGRAIENTCFSLAFASEDKTEGMRAFLEKRKPFYKGK
ncbi:MAG TPA: enoyl-CoA hydratase-related protein [Syntrophales bacterium]|jgi:enoyl-CoA hydratase|nr:enoyl-CoA hydratase-related protein [Syntrophales bacterium]HPL66226.1 enoyl-CoA hydratase-related protein [Smithellaceae bacterium]HOH72316.1 enoyl-CoA hydratase-related protein [Syntrophales bacterium]HPN08958.1 enoyl-CoA hydratase-related protein [Syntrophales bacterium]HPX80372.1 enoyl-CoA hydratase-related protein [Syntrophales bacterium]